MTLFDLGGPPAPVPAPRLPEPGSTAAAADVVILQDSLPGPGKSGPPSGPAGRVAANLAALATLRGLQDSGAPITSGQRDTLAGWSGWGAVPAVFDTSRSEWLDARAQLHGLLSDAEYAAASRSTLNAHYTDPVIVRVVWEAVTGLGFPGGRVLEPGCGSGNFIVQAPSTAQVTGVEVEPVTAAIAALRCPQAEIRCESFADTRFPEGWFDLVIGNVPFGRVALADERHNHESRSIHNHFIIKGLHLLRPGGLLAVVTSRYTLDALDDDARLAMHALADLVAAARLPSRAHQVTAGTTVVTDVLIFRRRLDGDLAVPGGWLTSASQTIDGHAVPLSGHFTTWPGAVLGDLAAVNGAYRAGDLSVTPHEGPLGPALGQILTAQICATSLPWIPAPADPDDSPGERELADDGQEEGHLTGSEYGGFTRVEDGQIVPHPVPRAQARELAGLLRIRDAALAVLAEETANPADTPQLARLRARLNAAYDTYVQAYGPVNRVKTARTGRIDPETGQERVRWIRPPQGGFRVDPHAPLVFALEDYNPEDQTAVKAPIFTQRVIEVRAPATSADDPADALAICLDTHGRVDLAVIAGLLGTDQDEARAALGTLVFNDPASSGGRELVPAPEYLSGNVRVALAAAEDAARFDPAYEANVTALRAVIPADLTAGEIDARLGASWISAEVVQDFLNAIMESTYARVEHPGGQIWHVRGGDYGVLARSTWGTNRASAGAIIHALLEQRRVEVRDPVGGGKYVLNVEETAAAQAKAEELQERFAEWVWEDPERARKLAREYNDRFNAIVLRSYDDAKLTLPGLSAAFTPWQHQIAAVARILAEPSVLLAHEVGAGKTAEMAMAAMEMRRLGLVTKPCVVVPGHILDQFAGEWLRLYPRARVLVTRREDLTTADRRRRLVARVATGDWDGIIMSQSTFERIKLRPEAVEAYLSAEAEQLREWLENAKSGGGSTVKRIERALLAAIERVKKKLAGAKDPGLFFEETGIDYLFIDEADLYKNLRTPSAINGAGIDGSDRASDLHMKIGWLRDRNGARVLTFATATPVANTVAELYVMIRYLRPDLLTDAGIDVFDVWAGTFGEQVTEVELAPEGGGSFRLKTRLAKYRNVPEMLRMFHVTADVKTAEDLNLERPELAPRSSDGQRVPEIVPVPGTPVLTRFVKGLSARAGLVRNRSVRPYQDNMLAITTDGRKGALHTRLVTGANMATAWHEHEDLTEYADWLRTAEAADHGPGKITAAARRIHAIWLENRDRTYPGSTARGVLQLVFCDLGTPRPGWSAYADLRDQLEDLGIPRHQVRFIHEAISDADKSRLFAACRAGSVAVLVGSTEKMGAGTNVQTRAIALHHLDAPWRPRDIAQREGRILRPRNLNPEVRIFRYVVAGSFDSFMWQALERKAKFIAQVMTGKLDVREIEDFGDAALSFAEVKALATGNPLLMDKAKADTALAKVQRAQRAHRRNQSLLAATVREQDGWAAAARARAAQALEAIARRIDTRADAFTMTVDGREYAKRMDAAVALAVIAREAVRGLHAGMEERHTITVGQMAGFPVTITTSFLYTIQGRSVTAAIALDGAPDTAVSVAPGDIGPETIRRLEYRVSRLEQLAADETERADRCTAEAKRAREALDDVFPRADELAAALAECARIDAEMTALARKTEQDEQAAGKPGDGEDGTGEAA